MDVSKRSRIERLYVFALARVSRDGDTSAPRPINVARRVAPVARPTSGSDVALAQTRRVPARARARVARTTRASEATARILTARAVDRPRRRVGFSRPSRALDRSTPITVKIARGDDASYKKASSANRARTIFYISHARTKDFAPLGLLALLGVVWCGEASEARRGEARACGRSGRSANVLQCIATYV